MAVLVEAISVIIRSDRLGPFGTWEAFKSIVPNDTLCADTELVRVGFMSPAEARELIDLLRSRGLEFSETGPAQDVAICDQQRGFTTVCPWAEYIKIDLDRDPGKPTGAARLIGSKVTKMATPVGWTWEESLTRQFAFIRTAETEHRPGSNCIRGETTGVPESGPHGYGIQVRATVPDFLGKRAKKPSLWDRLRGRTR